MKEVWFIRHGESMANAGAATSDPVAIPLTKRGNLQAEKLAAYLPHPPDWVVTSPYVRTVQTAAPTLARFSQARQAVWQVQEFTYLAIARCKHTTARDRKVMVDEYWERADPSYVDGAGAESFAEMGKRIQAMWERLQAVRQCNGKAAPSKQRIYIFTHGLFMNALRYFPPQALRALSPNSMRQFREYHQSFPIPNCGILKCQFSENNNIKFQPEVDVYASEVEKP